MKTGEKDNTTQEHKTGKERKGKEMEMERTRPAILTNTGTRPSRLLPPNAIANPFTNMRTTLFNVAYTCGYKTRFDRQDKRQGQDIR